MNIQALVDELCDTLGCSVAVDDAQMQLIAASAQIGRIDPPRSEAVLSRNTPAEVAAYGLSKVTGRGPEPFTVPENPALNTLPRWCFPLHQGMDTLGYLWLINDPELSNTDLRLTGEYADRMTLVLAAAHRQITEAARQSEHYLSRILRSLNSEALHQALTGSPLPAEGSLTLWCFNLRSNTDEQRTQTNSSQLARVVDRVLSNPLTPPLLAGHFDEHLAVATRTTRSAAELGRLLSPAIQRAATNLALTVAGWGWKQLEEEEIAPEAWEQAKFSAKIAELSPTVSGVGWEQVGAWSLLFKREWNLKTVNAISVRGNRLIQHDNPQLWKTLLHYFDLACDIKATATALHIERSTLYYRLGRIRDIAGPEILNDGWERTSAHLALKLYEAIKLE